MSWPSECAHCHAGRHALCGAAPCRCRNRTPESHAALAASETAVANDNRKLDVAREAMFVKYPHLRPAVTE
jgi:hypothetical protein